MQRSRIHILLLICVLLGWAAAPQIAPAAPEYEIPALDAAPFGLNTHLATRYPDLNTMDVPANMVAYAGAGWAREDIHWYRVQPISGVWDWSYTDAAIRALLQRRINIVAVLGHPPGWATPYGGDNSDSFSFYAPNPEQFAAFAAAVAQRYGRYIHYWEIWNEPDNALFWQPAPDALAYARLLQQTSVAIHSVAPDSKVVLGGINPFSTAYLKQVVDAGAWGSFDILAIHPYIDPASPEAGNLLAAADGVRALMTQYGGKPLWVTEVGWASGPSDHDPSTQANEQTQANMLVRAMLLLWRSGVERIFWYTLKDDPGNPYGLFTLGNGYTDYSHPKAAFFAFRTLSQQLAGAEFVSMRDLFTRTTVLDFEQFGAWIRGDEPNGTFTPSDTHTHSGHTAGRLSYRFPTSGNDYVVFRRDRPALVPGTPYALGIWVYGDGSGHMLKVWLRDAEGEVLQYTLGTVGPSGWRLLQAPINGTVPPWNRITTGGNGQLDFPARIESIVLDDGDDRFIGSGSILLDDIIAISGPEAYDIELNQGGTALDVLWSPENVRASILSTATTATVTACDGTQRSVVVQDGKITLDLGAAPVFVRHIR